MTSYVDVLRSHTFQRINNYYIAAASVFEEARKILTAAGYQMDHEFNIYPQFYGFSANMSDRYNVVSTHMTLYIVMYIPGVIANPRRMHVQVRVTV